MPFMIDGSARPPGFKTWDPEKYEGAVRYWLKEIRTRDVGRIMLDRTPKWVTVAPYIPPAGGSAENALSRPHIKADGFATGITLRNCRDGSLLPGNAKGTGSGTDVTVRFTPATWIGKTGPGEAPDEVLFHELVHSYRQSTGTIRCIAASHHMDTEEEIIAIAITNMYSSERNRPARRDHNGSQLLPREQHASWVQQHQGYLKSFYRRNEGLCKELLRQPNVSFNPFPF